ncbi:cilia- and flagella-associated protein 99-like [Aricia agestis]|uniref:cilia- and flagella-associated protein 99-like n=1 Tax=Aricia agestis TaxID=91739 RepID=UPI001C207262|nr:cilia- and flagella-associated protein 99-like [Aricia agestis]
MQNIQIINKDNVASISRIAQREYDKYFVTENILGSILSWQPFLLEISKTTSYNKYLNKGQIFNQKRSTSQIRRNIMLNVTGKVRKNKGDNNSAPRFTTNVKFKVFMNSKIRHHKYEKNNNVFGLLNTIKKASYCYYSMKKSTVTNSKFEDICSKLTRNNNSSTCTQERHMPKAKYTKCVVKRLNNVIKKYEQDELKWLHDIVDSCKNTPKVEKLLKQDQQEEEKQRLLKIKKNHLKGQISHEDAIIAKKNVCNENKRKYNEFIKEKQLWEKEIEDWKMKQTEYNRKQVEKMSLIELNLINSRNSMFEKRQEMAETVRYDTKLLKELILKNKEADLERKIQIIKEIKTLSMFARNSRMQKTIDLNESPGFGFLCEMSIVELQKRLAAIKISLQKELDEKKNKIKTLNTQKKLELEETKKNNDIFLAERERLRNVKKSEIKTDIVFTDEISRLEKMLAKRRNKRILLTKQNC